MKLFYPVYTLDNRPLLPEGADLSAQTLEDLISSGPSKPYKSYPLLEYGSVKKDLLRQMGKPPYDFIFSCREETEGLMDLMKNVRLLSPVLESLDYFKKDDYHTYCHILMVFALSGLITIDLLEDYQEWIDQISIGPTHDIGKICVPLDILNKATPLTRAEKSLIDHHTIAGYVLLSYFHKDPKNAGALVSRDHHERKDGSGGPRGIKLRNRAVEIVVACDVYDALIAPRPYRAAAYDNRTALEEITKMAEMNKIGLEVVKSLVAHNRSIKPQYSEVKVSTEKRGVPPAGNFYGVFDETGGDS